LSVPALDTNVLVRFLVQDDARQGAAARRLIRNGVNAGSALFVPVTVVLELEWVLRSSFGFEKAAVLQALFGLLGSFELSFESEGAVEAALGQYADGSADFADCLHAALALTAGQAPLWTFDKAAAKVDGAKLLTV
jgi:predicted nucleic-acid-binding protein